MPRGKAGLKSGTDGEDSSKQQSTVDDMKELEPVDISKDRTCESSKENELSTNITDMSVDTNTGSNEDSDASLPRKPKRLFTIAGSKKKDAKRNSSALKTDNNKLDSPEGTLQQKKPEIPKTRPKKKNVPQSYKRQFFDDDHPYEDPSLLVNNSTTPSQNTTHSQKKSSMDEQPQSPKSFTKSTESVKEKDLKEKHPSIMSETSIPRSIFASLVALLLSLIVFLAVYFLLQSHAVLSISVAVLVYVVIFSALGFMDGKRMKCLILLLLPSICSRGGRIALYLLVGYFVITGPLCNMIGNIQTVRNSFKCNNNEQPEVIDVATKSFQVAQQCIATKQVILTNLNQSIDLSCLQRRCYSVKDQFEDSCHIKDEISPTVCNLSRNLSCINESASAIAGCPKNYMKKHCQEEFDGVLKFLDEDTGNSHDSCGFMGIISMLFPLLVLFVFYEGYSYQKNYKTYNNFHNFFLTNHFQVIDQSRSSCDRAAVLPLRKVELRKHVRPATLCNLTDVEKKQLCSHLKTYIVFLLIVLFLILADLYMFRMFDLKNTDKVRSKMNSDISRNISEHFREVNLTVLLNQTLEINNTTKLKGNTTEVNTTSVPKTSQELPHKTTDICSTSFDAPGYISKIILPIVLSLLLLVILLQAHVSRLRWYICSQLYAMREKERVFYLYNKILEDRIQLVEKCRERMKCYHREMKTLNSSEITRILARQVGWLSKIFKLFNINLRRCIICNDKEKPEFKICHGLDCSGVYCLTCSFDIDKKCLYCDTELKHSLALKQNDEKDLSSKESLV